MHVRARTLSGQETRIERAAVDAFALRLGGGLVLPDADGYEDARRVWNGMIDRRPAAIARCSGAADVAAAVRFAREHDLLVAVRGGGHNVAGFATCDGGLVIDLSPMRSIRVDPVRRTVRVQAGVVWGELDRETQPFRLAVPGGVVSTTGVAGLTLGGGQGWLRRTYGMTCDSLLSADVVTASGETVTAGEGDHRDLFWALRGGGGNFGVVTDFEFRLHPAGPLVAFAASVYSLDCAPDVVRAFREFMRTAPDEINAAATFWTLPAASPFPASLHGRDVVILNAMYNGSIERGREALQPLRTLGAPLFEMSGPMAYTALQQSFDPFFPARELCYYWKALCTRDLDATAISTLIAAAARRPTRKSMLVLWALGGAMSRVGPDETAVGSRDCAFTLEVMANWKEPADTAPSIAWAREVFGEVRRLSAGTPGFNFPGVGEDMRDFVTASFGPAYPRLLRVKQQYDPSNLFRLNQNIT
jgi:FAD/FMN-containing dehydrogenase